MSYNRSSVTNPDGSKEYLVYQFYPITKTTLYISFADVMPSSGQSFNSASSNPFTRQGGRNGVARKRPQASKFTSCPSKKPQASKTWIKDVILLPSPRIANLPRGNTREILYDEGFVISGFKLVSTATESEITHAIERELADKFVNVTNLIKFHFVRAVEKKIVKVRNTQEINGEVLKHLCGLRDKPIYIRATEEMLGLLSNPNAFDGDFVKEESNSDVDFPLDSLDGISDSELLTSVMPSTNDFDIPLTRTTPVHAQEVNFASCPICSEQFTLDAIEIHASTCSNEMLRKPKEQHHEFKSLSDDINFKSREFVPSCEPIKFVVRRTNLFTDMMKKMKIFFDDSSELKPITVEFVGEPAADVGGPLREMFTLFYDIAGQKLMCGQENNYSFQHDVHKVESGQFEIFGKVTALALLHGFSGPHYFCMPLTQFMLSREKVNSNEHVPDYDVKEKLDQIRACNDQDELNGLVEKLEERFEAGYNKPTILLKDRDDFVEKVSWHWTVVRQLRELQCFEKGLQSNGVLDMLKRHPTDAAKEFMYDRSHLTSSIMRDLFQCRYSEEGTPERGRESDVMFNWCNFLDEAEKGLIPEATNLDFGLCEVNCSGEVCIKLEDVLFFATGSRFLPPVSMGKGTIEFMHGCKALGRRVQVSTCSLKLTIPVTERYSGNNFTANIVQDIIESPGFGTV